MRQISFFPDKQSVEAVGILVGLDPDPLLTYSTDSCNHTIIDLITLS